MKKKWDTYIFHRKKRSIMGSFCKRYILYFWMQHFLLMKKNWGDQCRKKRLYFSAYFIRMDSLYFINNKSFSCIFSCFPVLCDRLAKFMPLCHRSNPSLVIDLPSFFHSFNHLLLYHYQYCGNLRIPVDQVSLTFS